MAAATTCNATSTQKPGGHDDVTSAMATVNSGVPAKLAAELQLPFQLRNRPPHIHSTARHFGETETRDLFMIFFKARESLVCLN